MVVLEERRYLKIGRRQPVINDMIANVSEFLIKKNGENEIYRVFNISTAYNPLISRYLQNGYIGRDVKDC
ncbi:MAG: hypothetical protein BGN96_09105 [Bacteroidales bacterium 45-6]|nr:MAG: hypothetical protein BGN96_09105 [Bacteroidales bacterium 45-6]